MDKIIDKELELLIDLYGRCGEDYRDTVIARAAEELKHYRNLSAQGRLVVLPCKVGDTVYVLSKFIRCYEVIECRVTRIAINSKQSGFSISCHGVSPKGRMYNGNFRISSFGKTVYLTRAEAEAKLAEKKEQICRRTELMNRLDKISNVRKEKRLEARQEMRKKPDAKQC